MGSRLFALILAVLAALACAACAGGGGGGVGASSLDMYGTIDTGVTYRSH